MTKKLENSIVLAATFILGTAENEESYEELKNIIVKADEDYPDLADKLK